MMMMSMGNSWRPSQHPLDQIQKDRVLFDEEPTDEDILQALTNHPNSTVITVSHKAANSINQVCSRQHFRQVFISGLCRM